MISDRQKERVILIVQIACICLFAGRAWQGLFWEFPLRTLVWDEGLLKPFIENYTTWTWTEYATSSMGDQVIQWIIMGMGFFYALCAALCLTPKLAPRLTQSMIIMASVSLLFLSFLYCKEKFFHLGQFLEYALQVTAPLFLLTLLNKERTNFSKIVFYLKLSTSLTFICHGLYAIGYYPVPGPFLDMTMELLPVGDQGALVFLKIAGILDILFGVGLFVPHLLIPSIYYCIIWGTATASARVFSQVSWEFLGSDLFQWLPETLYRLPHGLLPLAALIIINRQKETHSVPSIPESSPREQLQFASF